MTEKTQKIEVRDNRGNKRYFIDDLFYDRYARLTAPHGLPVYNALCRRANKKQKSWPGVEAMSEELGISRKSVFAGLEILEYLRIIRKDRIGKKVTNRYTLLAQSSWRKDWEVMLLEVTSHNKSEVPLRYFTGFSQKLHKFLTGTSIGRKHREGNTEKDAEASSAPSSESQKTTGKGCCVYKCTDAVAPDRIAQGAYCHKHSPMTAEQFVAWARKSDQRHIRIIGEWAAAVADSLIQKTRGQWMHYIKRNVRTARRLAEADYDDEQLAVAYQSAHALREEMARHGKNFNPSLETLEKQLTK